MLIQNRNNLSQEHLDQPIIFGIGNYKYSPFQLTKLDDKITLKTRSYDIHPKPQANSNLYTAENACLLNNNRALAT